jgi:hypothetical protein
LLFNPSTNRLHIADFVAESDITIPAPIKKIRSEDNEEVIVFKKGTRKILDSE